LGLICIYGALAQDFGNCKSCEFAVKIFFGHLRDQRGVNFQIGTLSREVCPQQEHPFMCDYEVGKRWPGINHIVYQDHNAPYICTSLGAGNCTAFEERNREWNCDNCMRDVVLMATQYSLPNITHMFERYLSHEGYCEDPALGLPNWEIEKCQDALHVFLAPAFRALDAAYTENAQAICHYWYDDVCPRP
jgi:hypothetical protein